MNSENYERYNLRLIAQMQHLSGLMQQFAHAVGMAGSFGADQTLVHDASSLLRELAGQPGDAALEVYRDLASNIQSTSAFLSRWRTRSGGTEGIIQAATAVHEALMEMQQLVDATPPDVLDEIKGNVSILRSIPMVFLVAIFVIAVVIAIGAAIFQKLLG